MTITCRDCGGPRNHHSRGLCRTCYNRTITNNVTCRDCQQTKKHKAHGLCSTCYWRRRQYSYPWDGPPPAPKPVRRFADTHLDEYDFLRSCGESHHQIAARFGVKPASLSQALYRAGRGWVNA